MKSVKIKQISLCAIFTALIAASSWISIPTPFLVNLTLQTFAVSLAAFCLGAKWGVAAVITYIAIGSTGMPVFSSFTGGFGVLFGTSGGFLWGFIITALLCGISKNIKKRAIKLFVVILAVLACHLIGVIQFCAVSGNKILVGFLTASLPFLAKDLILAFLARFIATKIKI